MQSLATEPFRELLNLEELDLSNNKIRQLADTSFHFLKKLKKLELQDNIIEELHKGTFQVRSKQFLICCCYIYFRATFTRI